MTALPTGYALEAWIDELTRVAREQAAQGRGGTAGMLFDLGNYLADLRDWHRRNPVADPKTPSTHRLALSAAWISWIAGEAYTAGGCAGTPPFSETSSSVRTFMIRRTVATIKALGAAHKALSANPDAQPPNSQRKEGNAQ